jgi:hypothetical protein
MNRHPWEALDCAYAEMAHGPQREAEAREWCEGLIGDLELDDPVPDAGYSATA